MNLNLKGGDSSQADFPISAVDSVAIVERYRFRSKQVLLGADDKLYLATSESGRDWKWYKQEIIKLPARLPPQKVIIEARYSGDRIHVLIKRSGNEEKDLLILDAQNPWNILSYLENYKYSHVFYENDDWPKLDRAPENPIISPQFNHSWEAFTTLNPAAFVLNDKVHLLYRAQGHDYVSSIGYATSKDGLYFDYRSDQPIYSDKNLLAANYQGTASRQAWVSGGGMGGVEDPRVTLLENKVHMTYVAYDGVTPPFLAHTSLSVEDFIHKNWRWKKPTRISRPGIVDKSGAIFPEKIKGKYVVMHRVFPNIQIDYRDSLDFNEGDYLETHAEIPVSDNGWDSRKIGAGPPPLLTDEGWLLIYYGVDDAVGYEYHIGAMLLAKDQPEKVLARSSEPILSPQAHYEMTGFKPGILYPCGAVILHGVLFVYYGAADQYVCVATISVADLLKKLKHEQKIKVHSTLAYRPYHLSASPKEIL